MIRWLLKRLPDGMQLRSRRIGGSKSSSVAAIESTKESRPSDSGT